MGPLKLYYVYILTNKSHTVLYTGVTNNLVRRCNEHLNQEKTSFTTRCNVNKLIYYELFDYPDLAINREKQIKGYSPQKKVDIINKMNPEWNSLLLKLSKKSSS